LILVKQKYRQFRADVYCENGVIKAVGENLTVPNDARVIDATGRFVLPGEFHFQIVSFKRKY
jgi:dihydroorotase-like cyclic amidohydrolase